MQWFSDRFGAEILDIVIPTCATARGHLLVSTALHIFDCNSLINAQH